MTLQGGRRILLALKNERLDERVLFCARNIARRVDAGIEILLMRSSGPMPKVLKVFLEKLLREGVDYCLTYKSGSLVQDTVRYANEHEGILLVVLDSLDGWNDSAPDGDKSKEHWKRLACPLVIATACDEKS